MFREFLNFFNEKIDYKQCDSSYQTFLTYLGGRQFGKGVFNSFNNENVKKWTRIIEEAYPQFRGKFQLFGYDWLGRCFGINITNSGSSVLMFEIGTNEVLEIPVEFTVFLNEEIPLYNDACLATSFYKEWLLNNQEIKYERCVGYKVPLFLGGEDVISNLEDSDMEVYWHIISEIKKNRR